MYITNVNVSLEVRQWFIPMYTWTCRLNPITLQYWKDIMKFVQLAFCVAYWWSTVFKHSEATASKILILCVPAVFFPCSIQKGHFFVDQS